MLCRETRKGTGMTTSFEEEGGLPYAGKNPRLQALRDRMPSEWRRLFAEVPEGPAKDKARCVAWWDFMADEDADSDPDVVELKPAFGAGHGAEPALVRAVLEGLGYPERFADKRSREPKSYLAPASEGGRKMSGEWA